MPDGNDNFQFANDLTSFIGNWGKGGQSDSPQAPNAPQGPEEGPKQTPKQAPTGIAPAGMKGNQAGMAGNPVSSQATNATSSILPQLNGPSATAGSAFSQSPINGPSDGKPAPGEAWKKGVDTFGKVTKGLSKGLAGMAIAVNPNGPGGKIGNSVLDRQRQGEQDQSLGQQRQASEAREQGYFGIAKQKADMEMDAQKAKDARIKSIFGGFGLQAPAEGTFSALAPQTPTPNLTAPTAPNLQANLGGNLPSAPNQNIAPGALPQNSGSMADPNKQSIVPPIKAKDYSKEDKMPMGTPDIPEQGSAPSSKGSAGQGIVPKSIQERLTSKDPAERQQAALETELKIAVAMQDPDKLMQVVEKMGGVGGTKLNPNLITKDGNYMDEFGKDTGIPAGAKPTKGGANLQQSGVTDKGYTISFDKASGREIATENKTGIQEPYDPTIHGITKTKNVSATSMWNAEKSALTPEAVETEGSKYAITGKMPSLGMNNPLVRAQIINGAANYWLKQGKDPSQVPALQTEYTATAKAFTGLKSAVANFTTYESAMIKNMDYAEKVADKVYRTGVPTVNKILNAIKTGTGDPDIVEFSNALYAAAMEAQKLRTAGRDVSTSELSIGAQEKVKELVSTASSPAQLKSALKAMKTDANNVMDSKREELGNLNDELQKGDFLKKDGGGGKKSSASGKPAPPEVYQKAFTDFKSAKSPAEMKAKVKDWVAQGLSKDQINQIGAAIGYK